MAQIKRRITRNVDVSVKIAKKIIRAKKITFGILIHEVLKILDNLKVLLTIQLLRVMNLSKKQKLFQQKLF